jgi:hypothetical protein
MRIGILTFFNAVPSSLCFSETRESGNPAETHFRASWSRVPACLPGRGFEATSRVHLVQKQKGGRPVEICGELLLLN